MGHVEFVSQLMGSCAASATDRSPPILGDPDRGAATHGSSECYPHCVSIQVYTPVDQNTEAGRSLELHEKLGRYLTSYKKALEVGRALTPCAVHRNTWTMLAVHESVC